MRKRGWLFQVALGLGMFAGAGSARAEVIGGVEFPQGAASFADRVVAFGIAANVSGANDDPASVLGIPDMDVGPEPHFSLGNATASVSTGFVTIEFIDNRLIDVEGADLYIFEVGPAVEATNVDISRDGSTWYAIGRISGGTRAIDLADFPEVPDNTLFRYVRLTDYPDGSASGAPYAGPDIDAIGAIGADVADGDDDGVHDDGDNCIEDSNPGQENQDSDPLGDVCDACPTVPGIQEFGGCEASGEGGAGGADGSAGDAGAPSLGGSSGGSSEGGAAGEPVSGGSGEGGSGEGGAAGDPGLAGAGGEYGESGGEAGEPAASTGGSGALGGTGGRGGNATGGKGGSGGKSGSGSDDDSGEDGGCSCRSASSEAGNRGLAWLGVLGVAFGIGRRRSRRVSAAQRLAP